ncbi:class II glutamine amidotransferase [Mycolicibacterium sp. J2]|uniref:class II glutamine amidotransferase n=1 Tax=Mycolicibacterium sp. J2 TaxID=2993511 RepID=UPI00224B2162|nr:class II glutamine amidotransferase [Mycolicibacterium sp. J2]MCX2713110.1 class II glutamine amidotransferase [Mycolicibacterium sp. J2]
MCRLLGVVSTEPVTVEGAVGAHVVKDFVALTKVHGDGWGVAGTDGGDPRVHVSAASAIDDPDFAAVMRDWRSRATMVHLRWATSGLAVRPENSHPFLADGLAMAHNGSIKPTDALDALLEPDLAGTLGGTTDSERYFAVIRAYRRQALDLASAVRAAVARLRAPYPDASLNALILGEGHLIAVHANARSTLSVEDVAEITAADLPTEHLEDYFGLRWARTGSGALVIGSTGFGDMDWQPLPPESVTAISLRDLTMTTVPVMAD